MGNIWLLSNDSFRVSCIFRIVHVKRSFVFHSFRLLRLLGDWKTALDKNQYVAAILMDLSKAFDCLPHDILLCKLSAYGLSPKSVELLRNYLTGRKQQIKLQGDLSSWADIQKWVPQISILGPLLLKFLLTTSFILLNMVHCIIMLMITPCLM